MNSTIRLKNGTFFTYLGVMIAFYAKKVGMALVVAFAVLL